MKKRWKRGESAYIVDQKKEISMDHIIPVSRGGIDPRILGLLNSFDNCVCACKKCNSTKSDRDVFEWYGPERIDEIPKLVLSKFLKLAYSMHETQGTLDLKDPNMDGVLNIYDLGVVITNLISKISTKLGKNREKS